MILLSITGVFRTILILIAVFVILRFLGKLMMVKRNLDEEKRLSQNREDFQKAKEQSERKQGKISIIKGIKEAEDVDFEEIKEN